MKTAQIPSSGFGETTKHGSDRPGFIKRAVTPHVGLGVSGVLVLASPSLRRPGPCLPSLAVPSECPDPEFWPGLPLSPLYTPVRGHPLSGQDSETSERVPWQRPTDVLCPALTHPTAVSPRLPHWDRGHGLYPVEGLLLRVRPPLWSHSLRPVRRQVLLALLSRHSPTIHPCPQSSSCSTAQWFTRGLAKRLPLCLPDPRAGWRYKNTGIRG